jgi:uncharacterized protein
MEFLLSTEEKRILIRIARETVAAALEGRQPILPHPTDNLKSPCGAFVTLEKSGTLRGCIGHMTGIAPLFETIRQMANAAAFEDPRFPPVEADELSELSFEISVLSPLEKASDPSAIRVGTHGIYLVGKGRSGVLLPQVAVEYGWDRETFIRQTCRKAGLPQDAYQDPGIIIYIFTAVIFDEGVLED